MKTGLDDLDKLVQMQSGDLVIIQSRPGVGKSTLARKIAVNAMKSGYYRVIYHDLQNTLIEFQTLMLCMMAEVERIKIGEVIDDTAIEGAVDKGFCKNIILESQNDHKKTDFCISDHELQCLVDSSSTIREWIYPDFQIYDMASLKNHTPFPAFEDYYFDGHTPVIFVDGLQQAAWSEKPDESILSYLMGLKKEAVKEGAIVIVTSSSSSEAEKRAPRIPKISEISYCKGAADIADVVISLDRREYYDPLDKPGMMQLHVIKNRRGPLGSCTLCFNKKIPGTDNLKPLMREKEDEDDDSFDAFAPC